MSTAIQRYQFSRTFLANKIVAMMLATVVKASAKGKAAGVLKRVGK